MIPRGRRYVFKGLHAESALTYVVFKSFRVRNGFIIRVSRGRSCVSRLRRLTRLHVLTCNLYFPRRFAHLNPAAQNVTRVSGVIVSSKEQNA